MSKTSIKIIKRNGAEAARGEIQNSCEPKSEAAVSSEKIERRLRRSMVETVSKWIAERRKITRAEEVSAFRKLFGEEFLSGRAA